MASLGIFWGGGPFGTRIVQIQQRILTFVTRSNWLLLIVGTVGGFLFAPPAFAWGIVCGGIIVTGNFFLLARTLRKALAPPHVSSHNVIIAKYYLRFLLSGVIIFGLLASHLVNPVGLVLGLSMVVASIILATVNELTILIRKEAH